MRRLKCLFTGVVLGFVAAHLVNQTPRGRRLFAQINSGIEEFKKAFAEGYRDTADAATVYPATSAGQTAATAGTANPSTPSTSTPSTTTTKES